MKSRSFIQWYLVRGIVLCIALNFTAPSSFGQSFGISTEYRSIRRVDNGPHVALNYEWENWSVSLGSTFNPNIRIHSFGNNISYANSLDQHLSWTLDGYYKIYENPNHQIWIGLANGSAHRDFWTYSYSPLVNFPNAPAYIKFGALFIDRTSHFSKNVPFTHHSFQLISSHRFSRRTSFNQSVGLGILTTSALEYNFIESGWELVLPNFIVGFSHWIGKDGIGNDRFEKGALSDNRNSISLQYSDGIVSNGFVLKYTQYSKPFTNEIGVIINAPIIHNEKFNQVYHQRGKVRGLADILGLQAGVMVPFRMLGFTVFPYYSLEIKKQKLLTSWFEDTGIVIPDSIAWQGSVDDKVYAYYYYVSEAPVISFENFVGLGARFDLSDKVFIEERLGVGLGFYIHEFEDYYPGPKKHHEFVFPYFSLGLGYKL